VIDKRMGLRYLVGTDLVRAIRINALKRTRFNQKEVWLVANEALFRIALAPSAILIWARYIVWPLVTIGVSVLVYFNFKPNLAWTTRLNLVRRAMVGLAVLLGFSLILAYLMIPDHNKQLGVFWFGALLGSLPVLIPSSLAIFLCPSAERFSHDYQK
jgi:hypothetical protein